MKKETIKRIINISAPLFILYFFESYFFRISKALFLSILIIYAVYLLLISLFKNTKWALLIMSVLAYIIFVISMLKLSFINEPFYFSDILYSNNTGEIFSIVEVSFKSVFFHLLKRFLYVLIMYICIDIFGFKYNYHVENKKVQLSFFLVGFLILFIMFAPIRPINRFIIKNFYSVNSRKDYNPITTGLGYCYKFGHFAGMYGDLLESRIFKPKNYDAKKIDEVLKNSPIEEDKSLGKPNIIVIFSESFWDIDQLDEIEFSKPVTSNFNKLKEDGLFFNMISPSFGGISANVEFEFLTGGSLNYYGRSYVPYMSLYRGNKQNDAPNIIAELRKAGYYTKMVTFTSPLLFSCGQVYKIFKVDETEYNTDVAKKYYKGLNVSDEYVIDKVISELENKDYNKPLFYMTLTMQAHMPYVYENYDKYDIKIVKSPLKDKYNKELLFYAQSIYDADKELGRLYEYIKNYDEPTIIIFYGDHLPHLDSINYLSYFHTEDEKLNVYRKYNTQSLVLANYDIDSLKEENKKIKYLGPDLLSSYVLNHMDIDLSDYYRWLYSTKELIGASNRYVSVNQEGKIYYTEMLEGKMEELNDFRESVQYKLFIK